jgi:hypothetical protein
MRSLASMLVAVMVLYFLDSIWFYGTYFRAVKTVALQLWQHFVG